MRKLKRTKKCVECGIDISHIAGYRKYCKECRWKPKKTHIPTTRITNTERYFIKKENKECYFCDCVYGLHIHHIEYKKPLKTIMLCPRCHGRLHQIMKSYGINIKN